MRSAARFNNLQCKDGIVCIADKGRDRAKGVLKICNIPEGISSDTPWPLRTKHVGMTIHHVAFHAATGCLVLVVSSQQEMEDERK